MSYFYHFFLRWPVMLRLLLLAIALNFSFGAAIHFVEPQRFPNVFLGIYWAFITTATVGYGDLYPVTGTGKLLCILLVLSGAGILSAYFISLSSAAVTKQNAYMEGKEMFKGKDHFIIAGWNERAKRVIEQLLSMNNRCQIVLIDHSLEETPYPKREVVFVKGKPHSDETLKRANLSCAQGVLITADQKLDESHADMNSIMILLAVKGLCPSLFCSVEILTTENEMNASRAGADEIIHTNIHTSLLMANSLVSNGHSASILTKLKRKQDGQAAVFIETKREWIGKTFEEISDFLLDEHLLLIGVKRGEEIHINPSPLLTFTVMDELLVIRKST